MSRVTENTLYIYIYKLIKLSALVAFEPWWYIVTTVLSCKIQNGEDHIPTFCILLSYFFFFKNILLSNKAFYINF